MADTNDSKTEEFQSVEIDAAPSVEFVNLGSLDIGSECEVKSEFKPGSSKVELDTVPIQTVQEEDENELSSVAISNAVATAEKKLETGLGSLNLEENEPEETKPEVPVADDILKDGLLSQDNDGDTLLHVAMLVKFSAIALELIELMAEEDVSLDIPNQLHQTPLHLAVLAGNSDIVRALLLAEASPFRRDHELRTPMFIACEKNDMSVLEVFFEHANWKMTDSEVTSKLLDPNINPLNMPDAYGERCLHQAARHNNRAMAQKLIENGADANLPDRRSGRTPLHVAADIGHIEMIEYLVSLKEMDINQRTYNEETALEIAHMRERVEVVASLKPRSFPVMKRKAKNDISTG